MASIAAARQIAVGLLVLTCATACAMHGGPDATPARDLPVQRSFGATIESQDKALAAALLLLRLSPSPARHRDVATEYRRLRIDDAAFDHLTAATRLDPADAAAYDGRARIWRDWGFPQMGMADAARAVFYAPGSAEAHNTRGTLLAAVGQTEAARRDFEMALSLNPGASYALDNLRYLDRLSKAAGK
jgi:tetratricopeptide (TPR) repeat protein